MTAAKREKKVEGAIRKTKRKEKQHIYYTNFLCGGHKQQHLFGFAVVFIATPTGVCAAGICLNQLALNQTIFITSFLS